MGILLFLSQLQESGGIVLENPSEPRAIDLEQCDGALLEIERLVRPTLAWEPPELSLPVARWAARMMYAISQTLVFRDIDGEALERRFARRCPGAPSPSRCYSVDLMFQYLPDVFSIARRLAPGDPLVDRIRQTAREWPLSSVGTPEIGAVSTDAFWDSRSLRQLYIDRILARNDRSRLSSEVVRGEVRASLGLYRDLCPEIAAALDERSRHE